VLEVQPAPLQVPLSHILPFMQSTPALVHQSPSQHLGQGQLLVLQPLVELLVVPLQEPLWQDLPLAQVSPSQRHCPLLSQHLGEGQLLGLQPLLVLLVVPVQ
jgi:hypothetical protein